MDQWDIAPCTSVCTATGRPLEENEKIYAELIEDGDSFIRQDYSLDAWQGPPVGAFCFFRTRVPQKQKKRRLLVDDDVLVNLFLRLGGETQETRVHFRFVLALILMRKRLLKYEDSKQVDGGEQWQMRMVKDQSMHHVVNPQLSEDEIQRVSRELGTILHGDMGEFDDALDGDVSVSERDSSDEHNENTIT